MQAASSEKRKTLVPMRCRKSGTVIADCIREFFEIQMAGAKGWQSGSRVAHANMTAEQFPTEIIQDFIVSDGKQVPWKYTRTGDEAENQILKLIGVSALSENETRKVLSIIHMQGTITLGELKPGGNGLRRRCSS